MADSGGGGKGGGGGGCLFLTESFICARWQDGKMAVDAFDVGWSSSWGEIDELGYAR